MRTSTLKQILIVSMILVCRTTFGQFGPLPAIDSMKIIPENPEAGDEIKLVCYTTFSSGGCDMQNYDVAIQGNQVVVHVNFMPGAATYMCHSTDTIPLGNFGAGNYGLHANLVIQPMNSVEDTASINFSIGGFVTTSEHIEAYSLVVSPNPFTDKLRINTDAVIERMEIRSVSGQEISLDEAGIFNQQTVDVSHLQNGLYILTAIDNKGNRYTGRILKNGL
jgi:hypothetical protein